MSMQFFKANIKSTRPVVKMSIKVSDFAKNRLIKFMLTDKIDRMITKIQSQTFVSFSSDVANVKLALVVFFGRIHFKALQLVVFIK